MKVHSRRYVLCLLLALWTSPAPGFHASAEGRRNWAELVESLSEPGGYFDSDNLISNETSYVTVLPRLRDLKLQGGVYIGVGPDQNFTYLTTLRPEQAIVIDIRRQNMLQHLLLKALMERARSRLEYLALLVSRPVTLPADLGRALSIEELLHAVDSAPPDLELYGRNLRWVLSHIGGKFGLHLSKQDLEAIDYVYGNFREYGLDIRYRSYGRPFQRRYPTLRGLILERDLEGEYGNYLALESNFQWLKKFQEENHLIPVVGDLGGKAAMKKIARYLTQNHRQVQAFYVSNVEFYLMRNGAFDAYVENVRRLPVRRNGIFIRSYFGYGMPHPEQVDGHWMSSVLQYIGSFLRQQDLAPYYTHRDLATRDYISILKREE